MTCLFKKDLIQLINDASMNFVSDIESFLFSGFNRQHELFWFPVLNCVCCYNAAV